MKEKKPIGFVYLTTNQINGKVYVGQRQGSPKSSYIGSGGTHFQNALKKYGRENFKREILKECYTEKQLNFWETYYSKKYNPSLDSKIGYNKCHGPVQVNGGRNPAKHPETLKRMIKSNRRTTSCKEYREKQSEIMKEYFRENPANFKGQKHTEEAKQIMSEKAMGRKAWNKGVPATEEQKRKQSEIMKGRYVGKDNPNYGNRWSEESRKRLSEIKKKQYKGRKWVNDGTVERFAHLEDGVVPKGFSLGRLKRKG